MIRAFTCLLCFVLLSFSPALAQHKTLQFQPIHLPGTFPERGVYKTIQDKAGLLWYVTNYGLYRYDGNEVLHIGLNTSPALPYPGIWRIRADGRGNIWLGDGNGAAKFDLKKWKITSLYSKKWTRNTPKDKGMSAIGCLPNGKVYYGTGNGKLYLVVNDSLRQVAAVKGCISYIDEPVPGQLWLAMGSNGQMIEIPILNGVYQPPKYFRFEELKGKAIDKICYDSTGRFLMDGNSHLYYGDVHDLENNMNLSSSNSSGPPVKGLIKPVEYPSGNRDVPLFYQLFYMGKKDVAIRTGAAEAPGNYYIFNFRNQTWNSVTGSLGVKFPGYVREINHVSSGAVISSSESINMMQLRNLPFSVSFSDFESRISIRSIYKTGDEIYIATYPQGVFRYNLKSGRAVHISNRIINHIIPWNKDTLLIASHNEGLLWYFPGRNTFKHSSYKGHPQGRVSSTVIFRVNDSLILKGSYLGTSLINMRKGIDYKIPAHTIINKGFYNCVVHAIIPLGKKSPAKLGTYLIGTSNGVYRLNADKRQTRYFLSDTVPDKIRRMEIFSLMEVSGKIWMGSGGLGVLATDYSGRLCSMNWLNSKLNGDAIYSLSRLGDEVYIGTNKGLNILHLKDSSISYYTTNDGLPANEFNPAAVFNDGKELYLGTINGIVRWGKSASLNQGKVSLPGFHINKLIVVNKNNNRKISYNFPYLKEDSQRIIIPANAKYFSLTFGSPGETNKSLSYSYRLNPNEDWINLGEKREITFIKTPPGDYKLQFATKLPGGELITHNWSIPLIIKPSFGQTIWFEILICIIVTILLGFIFRYREVQKNKERNLRMKIAGDLHDEVGSSLSTIWHQIRQILQRATPEMNGMSKPLQSVADISGEALSVMNDIVWSIDARFDTLDEFVLRMKDYVYKLQNELEISVTLEITGHYQNRKLSQIIRQNLFLLLKEAINNAMKHGDGNLISVKMNFSNKLNIHVQIVNTYHRDRKKYHEVSQGGRGLLIMQRRADNMHGELHIEEHENKFIITITV